MSAYLVMLSYMINGRLVLKPHILSLSLLSVLFLAGCESASFSKYNPFHHYSMGSGYLPDDTVVDVNMRADTGGVTKAIITPMLSSSSVYSQASSGSSKPSLMSSSPSMPSDPSVTIMPFDNEGYSSHQQRGQRGGVLPNFGGGVLTSDSSVTIFSLDGAAPMSMGGGSNMGYAGQGYSPSNMAGGGNQIFFKHGSSRLGSGDMRVLSSVAEQAKFAPVSRVTVAGYASPPTQVGSRSTQGGVLNLKESSNRAYAVSRTLIKKGVPAEKIKMVSWGATKSTGNNSQDRRVDIIMGEQ